MNRYAGVIVLLGLLVIPALLLARAPAPRPRPDSVLEASAAFAEQVLVKEYGADAKGIKEAKFKFAFLATRPDASSENGKNQYLFALAAEDIIYSGDGLVTLKQARVWKHQYVPRVVDGITHTGWILTAPNPELLQFRFAGPVRRLQDIHKSQLKTLEFARTTFGFDNAKVELTAKRLTD